MLFIGMSIILDFLLKKGRNFRVQYECFSYINLDRYTSIYLQFYLFTDNQFKMCNENRNVTLTVISLKLSNCCICSGLHNVPMIPLGLKETTECDLAIPIKASTCIYLYLRIWCVQIDMYILNILWTYCIRLNPLVGCDWIL